MKAQYRKKPVVIEAIKWEGNNLKEVIDFIGMHSSSLKWTWDEYSEVVASEGLKIFTLEGPMMASVGDMIIKGVNGELYPCKPGIFDKTYEPVETFGSDVTVRHTYPHECKEDHETRI